MPHAKSLRAIGQSLESLGVVAFIMEKNGRNYVVRSDSLPDVAQLESKKDLAETLASRFQGAEAGKKARDDFDKKFVQLVNSVPVRLSVRLSRIFDTNP